MSNTTTTALKSGVRIEQPIVEEIVVEEPSPLLPLLERLDSLEKTIELLQIDLEHQKEFNSILLKIINNIK